MKAFFTNLFSEGFIAFLILSVVAVRSVSGKLFDSWDEFSHWGDIVKAMSFLDDFGTNSLSFSLFKNYPPGMSLLQYFLEKLLMFFPKVHFEEWLTYFVYQVYCFSFLIPLFCLKTQKGAGSRIVSGLLSAAVVFFAPLTFAESIELRSGYDNLVSMIQTNCTSDDKLFLISEEDNGFDLIVLNETLRPLRFFNHDYSIGEPQYQGDEWTIPVSADELKREIADGYSFVAVKKINDYFRNEYSSLFATGENICGDTLYKVCDDGLLRACH